MTLKKRKIGIEQKASALVNKSIFEHNFILPIHPNTSIVHLTLGHDQIDHVQTSNYFLITFAKTFLLFS